MNNYTKKYNVEVNRIGLRTWLITSQSQSAVENVKEDLVYNKVSFQSEEVFIDNEYGMEIILNTTI